MSTPLARLMMAIDDLAEATLKRDKTVAIYLLRTEVREALHALEGDYTIDEQIIVDLLLAVASVERELLR